MVASLFGPPNLPQQVEGMRAELSAIREAVQAMAGVSLASPDPEAEMMVIPISSSFLPNPWYQTSDQLRVVAVDFWTNTNGRYAMQVENTQVWFRTNANNKQRVIDPPGRWVIPRGLRIGFTLDGQLAFASGAAVWDALIYAYAGTIPMRQDK